MSRCHELERILAAHHRQTRPFQDVSPERPRRTVIARLLDDGRHAHAAAPERLIRPLPAITAAADLSHARDIRDSANVHRHHARHDHALRLPCSTAACAAAVTRRRPCGTRAPSRRKRRRPSVALCQAIAARHRGRSECVQQRGAPEQPPWTAARRRSRVNRFGRSCRMISAGPSDKPCAVPGRNWSLADRSPRGGVCDRDLLSPETARFAAVSAALRGPDGTPFGRDQPWTGGWHGSVGPLFDIRPPACQGATEQ